MIGHLSLSVLAMRIIEPYDAGALQDDILGLREPIFAVRQSVAFGLEEGEILQNATRWRFGT
jgi:hypothetical protein